MLEFIIIGSYFLILVFIYILIMKRLKKIDLGHVEETGIDCLKNGWKLLKNKLIIIFITLFIVNSIIIIKLI